MYWDERIADMARKINHIGPICPTESDSVSLYGDYTKPSKGETAVGETVRTALW
jgi:hypothetical protein